MSAKPLTVVGMDGEQLPAAAMQALHEATLLIGADRHMWSLPNGVSVPRRPIGELDRVLDDLRQHDGPAVVLAAGDPGFFGIVRALRTGGLTPRVLPAPSAVQRVCAAIGRPWDDVAVVSADRDRLRAAVNVCRARPAVAVLTAPGAGPAELATELHGWQRTLVVVEDLGGPDERVSTVDAGRAGGMAWREPDIVLCLRDPETVPPSGWYAGGEPTPPAGGWGLPESRFSHRDGMLAAAEVRAVALAKLAPRLGTMVWDVGAGSGAMAVECGRLGAAVLAIERDPGQCVRIVANAAAHDVEVCVIEDSAPGVFGMLPEPDVIFVGGGGPGVVAACTSTGAHRIVVALTELDRFAECRDALHGNGFDVGGCQLWVSRFADSGGATRLAATGPVFLLCGTRGVG
jgi:precorrin-6B C5,15-methyltransferase / cobalt-precorrin-6B C5,C15-methyltransferase